MLGRLYLLAALLTGILAFAAAGEEEFYARFACALLLLVLARLKEWGRT